MIRFLFRIIHAIFSSLLHQNWKGIVERFYRSPFLYNYRIRFSLIILTFLFIISVKDSFLVDHFYFYTFMSYISQIYLRVRDRCLWGLLVSSSRFCRQPHLTAGPGIILDSSGIMWKAQLGYIIIRGSPTGVQS